MGWVMAKKLVDSSSFLGSTFTSITLKTSVHSLGVLLDLGLLHDVQVVTVAKSTYRQHQLVPQLCSFLDKDLILVTCLSYL